MELCIGYLIIQEIGTVTIPVWNHMQKRAVSVILMANSQSQQENSQTDIQAEFSTSPGQRQAYFYSITMKDIFVIQNRTLLLNEAQH